MKKRRAEERARKAAEAPPKPVARNLLFSDSESSSESELSNVKVNKYDSYDRTQRFQR